MSRPPIQPKELLVAQDAANRYVPKGQTKGLLNSIAEEIEEIAKYTTRAGNIDLANAMKGWNSSIRILLTEKINEMRDKDDRSDKVELAYDAAIKSYTALQQTAKKLKPATTLPEPSAMRPMLGDILDRAEEEVRHHEESAQHRATRLVQGTLSKRDVAGKSLQELFGQHFRSNDKGGTSR